jgi:hypothetical protein
LEAEKICQIFCFHQNRKARLQHRRFPLPRHDWWQMLYVEREEAERIIKTTELVLNSLK